MNKKQRKIGLTMVLGSLLLLGTMGPALAGNGRDTTKIKECNANSSAPTFLTCEDAEFLFD